MGCSLFPLALFLSPSAERILCKFSCYLLLIYLSVYLFACLFMTSAVSAGARSIWLRFVARAKRSTARGASGSCCHEQAGSLGHLTAEWSPAGRGPHQDRVRFNYCSENDAADSRQWSLWGMQLRSGSTIDWGQIRLRFSSGKAQARQGKAHICYSRIRRFGARWLSGEIAVFSHVAVRLGSRPGPDAAQTRRHCESDILHSIQTPL